MSGDTQLREILIAVDDLETSTGSIQGAGESELLLARGPERAAVSFTAGQDRLQLSVLKKGILKKGDALRRASANSKVPSSRGPLHVRQRQGKFNVIICWRVKSNRRLSAGCFVSDTWHVAVQCVPGETGHLAP